MTSKFAIAIASGVRNLISVGVGPTYCTLNAALQLDLTRSCEMIINVTRFARGGDGKLLFLF